MSGYSWRVERSIHKDAKKREKADRKGRKAQIQQERGNEGTILWCSSCRDYTPFKYEHGGFDRESAGSCVDCGRFREWGTDTVVY